MSIILHIEELGSAGKSAFGTDFYKLTMVNKDELIVVEDGFMLYELETGNKLSGDLEQQFYAALRSDSAKKLYAQVTCGSNKEVEK